MSDRERYLLNAIGDDHQATAAGLHKFVELCREYGDGVIYVPTMLHLDTTMLPSALSDEAMKALKARKPVTLPGGRSVVLCSDRTFKDHQREAVYVVLWATPDMIEAVEKDAHKCKAMVVVTWLKKDAREWVAKYNPTELPWGQ